MTPAAGVPPRVASAAELRMGYEDLRRQVLAHGGGTRSLGEGLVVSRGMAAWMRAWVEILPPPEKTAREASRSDGVLPAAGRGEMVAILAQMALGARKEE